MLYSCNLPEVVHHVTSNSDVSNSCFNNYRYTALICFYFSDRTCNNYLCTWYYQCLIYRTYRRCLDTTVWQVVRWDRTFHTSQPRSLSPPTHPSTLYYSNIIEIYWNNRVDLVPRGSYLLALQLLVLPSLVDWSAQYLHMAFMIVAQRHCAHTWLNGRMACPRLNCGDSWLASSRAHSYEEKTAS
jgi:hypothetical protein